LEHDQQEGRCTQRTEKERCPLAAQKLERRGARQAKALITFPPNMPKNPRLQPTKSAKP
jgi:hypothetical protein